MHFLSGGFVKRTLLLIMYDEIGELPATTTPSRPQILQVRSVHDLGKMHYGLCLTDGELAIRTLVEKKVLESDLDLCVKLGGMDPESCQLLEFAECEQEPARVGQLRVGSVISLKSYSFMKRLDVFEQNDTGEVANSATENQLCELKLLDFCHVGFSHKNFYDDTQPSEKSREAQKELETNEKDEEADTLEEAEAQHTNAATTPKNTEVHSGSIRRIDSINDLSPSLNKEAWQINLTLVRLSTQKDFIINNRRERVADSINQSSATTGACSFVRALFKDESNNLYCEAVAFGANCSYLERLEINKCYVVTRCKVKASKQSLKRWPNQLNSSNDIELTIDSRTKFTKQIEKEKPVSESMTDFDFDNDNDNDNNNDNALNESAANDQAITDNLLFKKLGMLAFCKVNTMVNVTGVVCGVATQIKQIEKKGWREGKLCCRYFYVVDETTKANPLRCSVWGKEAEHFNHEIGTVLLLRDCKLTDYEGQTLVVLRTSLVVDISLTTAAQALTTWWASSIFKKRELDPNDDEVPRSARKKLKF